MNAQPTFRDHIKAIEAIARAEGERDFADLLKAYSRALLMAVRDSEECRSEAQAIRDEAERLAARFEASADYLDESVRLGSED